MTAKLTSLFAAIAVVTMGCIGEATAAPIATYNFSQTSGFVFNNVTPTPGPIGNHGLVGSIGGDSVYQSLWWGETGNCSFPNCGPARGTSLSGTPIDTTDPDNPTATSLGFPLSALKVIGFGGSGDVDKIIGNNWVEISSVYHRNNPISINVATLLSGIIRSSLNITSGSLNLTNVNDVGFTFNETYNNVPSGPCSFGNPNGTICDDLFTFDISTFAPLVFWYDGFTYQVDFTLGEFEDSVVNACPLGECTIWTGENRVSRLSVFLEINQVPEPASLLLVGLGLLGLGFSARRKRVQ